MNNNYTLKYFGFLAMALVFLPLVSLKAQTIADMTSSSDPCPQPKTALSETPNDLKLIQEDITRFTLCLQRAQLLDRLNDLAQRNMQNIQTNLDDKIKNNFADVMQPVVMDTVPFPDVANSGDVIDSSTQPIVDDYITWVVNEINGKDGRLSAKLADGNGNIIYASVGDKIPNSDIKIKSITTTDVKVVDNGKERFLTWGNLFGSTAQNVQ